MTLKSLFFGSAAILAAGSGAQAADLPTAEPVEYVRICDAFGAGFYYMPGTDTCLKVGGQVRIEAHYVDTNDDDGDINFLLGGADDPEIDNYTTRARGNVRLDARTQTDFGLIRAFIDMEMTVGPNGGSSGVNTINDGDENNDGTGVSLAAAFIQITNDIGTFTAGHTGSFFDFFGSFDFGTRLDIDDNTTEQTLFAYTFGGGNGFSATISIEDPASSGRRLETAGFDFDNGGIPEFVGDDYEGQEAPDGVFNIRVDQGWGSAQVMGVVGQIHDNDGFPTQLPGDDTNPNDDIGWAVGAGLSAKVPFLTGLEFSAQGGYAEGRLGYISTDPGGFGDFSGPDAEDTTEGYAVRAGVRAGLTERVTASVSGSFTHVERDVPVQDDTPDEYDFWAVNGNVIFTPVEGLIMGPEVAYQQIEFDGDETEDDGEDNAWGAMFRIQRAF